MQKETLQPDREHLEAMEDWALDSSLVHLNHGSFGGVPNAVIDQQNKYRLCQQSAPVTWFASLSERLSNSRIAMAKRLNLKPDSCVIVPNASSAASVVYQSLIPAPSAKVITTTHGYGAVVMGARRFARRHQLEYVTVEIPFAPEKSEVIEALNPFLEPNNILIIDQITSATCTNFPVADICQLAKAAGTITIVDGAHAPGVVLDPAHQGEADFWFGNLHKFVCSPAGSAVLYAAEAYRNELWPLTDSWGGEESFPRRFDFVGTSDVTSYLCGALAWDYIEQRWGWEQVISYSKNLIDYGTEVIAQALAKTFQYDPRVEMPQEVTCMRLLKLPAPLDGPREQVDEYRLRMGRNTPFESGFTSFNGKGYLRLSAHAYNTKSDYERFADKGVRELRSWID